MINTTEPTVAASVADIIDRLKVTSEKPAVAKTNKSAVIIELLSHSNGATIAELISATSWQPHSLRAFLSGLRKKKRTIVRAKRPDGEPAYYLTIVAQSPSSEPIGAPAIEA